MIRAFKRGQSESERRFIRCEINRIRKDISTKHLVREGGKFFVASMIGSSIFSVFANYPWYWGMLGGVIFAAILFPIFMFDNYRKTSNRLRSLKKASANGLAKITKVSAKDYVSFEEFEDLGILYVFQVSPDKLFVLQGQCYYESIRFPCLQFEIVEIPEVLSTVRPLSPKVEPSKVFDDKTMLEVAGIQDRIILDGDVKDVLQILRAALL